jgi:M6 family metalloprotease-like protein
MTYLYSEYLKKGKPQGLSFKQYLKVIGFEDPAANLEGMDDPVLFEAGPTGIAKIAIPKQRVTGEIRLKVLLVDFPDREGKTPPDHYETMLFSKGEYPLGSLFDYYNEVSCGKINLSGSVHGWLRMPREYSFYTNNQSGTNYYAYPRNAQGMAEDAVKTALESGVEFEPGLDKLNQGIVTALFIIHAGRGAEMMHQSLQGSEIWSHKWNLRKPISVGSGLAATVYLAVPQECKVGVCAHELGHLAFQWQDFYDPNYDEDGQYWDGSGDWDLMAGGSYNGNGSRPSHPAALHKLQHGWIEVDAFTSTQYKLSLDPIECSSGKVIKLVSEVFDNRQYLLLENRSKAGFDFELPGEGLLVWRVDERGEMYSPDQPGMQLVQADGKHNLEDPSDWNQGDAGDPFPGSKNNESLMDIGNISTSFPGQAPSGIELKGITQDKVTGRITFDAIFNKPK